MEVILDRFEGEYALLELPNGEIVNVPRILLENATEGDVINISINKEKTGNRNKSIEELMDSVFKD